MSVSSRSGGGLLMERTRYWTFLAGSLLLAAILLPGSAALAASSTGHVLVTLDDGSVRTVSFSAEAGRDGDATGTIEIDDPTPLPDQDVDGTGDPALAGSPNGLRLVALVNCLAVDGDTAIVGGVVAKATLARYVGKQVLLFVEDSGKARGGFTWGLYEPGEYRFCGSFPWAAYTPEKVAGGSLQVLQ
jgi:hypothetical protein